MAFNGDDNDGRCSCHAALGGETGAELNQWEDLIIWLDDQWLASLLMWVWTREVVAEWWNGNGGCVADLDLAG